MSEETMINIEEKDQKTLELNTEVEDQQYEDNLWQAKTGLDSESLCGAIETIIFMSDRPVPLSKIRKLIDEDMPLRVLHESIEKLQEGYETKQHGIRLSEVGEGYQFRTKATFSKYVKDLFKVNSLVLTPSTLEVLAIIAYKQPVSKTEIEKIRGVDSSHIVRTLMDKKLVKMSGRSNELGRPTQYSTTQEFLEVFNLADLGELPPEHDLEEIANTNEVGNIEDIREICEGEKGKFKFDEIDELDKLSSDIKSIQSDTTFTKSLRLEDKKRYSEEGTPVKSAFDILEEYIINKELEELNKLSAESDLLGIGDPQVIQDFTLGPFNLPDEGDDQFEMIDLDTGDSVEVSTEKDVNLDTFFDEGNSESDEKQSLSDALDEAFSNLMTPAKEMNVNETDLANKESEIDELTSTISQKAQKMDFDLSFLNDESDK